jgi:hypothetical protein
MPPTRKQKIRLAAIVGSSVVIVAILLAVLMRDGGVETTGLRRPLPPPPPVPTSSSRDGRLKADDTLSKIRPGMPRVDVEAILGAPSAVDSIAAGNGKLSYRATFNRDNLRPPMPPIVLEFDATLPGHPLLLIRPM